MDYQLLFKAKRKAPGNAKIFSPEETALILKDYLDRRLFSSGARILNMWWRRRSKAIHLPVIESYGTQIANGMGIHGAKRGFYSLLLTFCPGNKRKVRLNSGLLKGGYRDLNPGSPDPQSGALTNYAIPTILRTGEFHHRWNMPLPGIPVAAHIPREPEGIRTPDPRLRRPLLYPAELQTH